MPSAVFVHCSGLNLCAAVAGADGDREGVDAGLLDEVLDFLRLGVIGVLGRDIVLDAGEHAELAFDRDIVLLRMGEVDDLLGERDVLVVGQVRAVDHDRGEARLDAALAELEAVAVVEVEGDRDIEAELLGVSRRRPWPYSGAWSDWRTCARRRRPAG